MYLLELLYRLHLKVLQIYSKICMNLNSSSNLNSNYNSVPAWSSAPPLPTAFRHVGPPSHASSTWVRHLHPHWEQIIDQKNNCESKGFEPKIFMLRYILHTTMPHLHMWLYLVFSIVILIIYYYNI
jgi:hypothetical protein